MSRKEQAADLDRSLARLAAPRAPVAEIVLRPFGRRTLLSALLEALDDTVLPRRLGVVNAAGATALFEVANRRLLRASVPGWQGPGAEDGAAPLAAVDPRDAEGLRRLGAAVGAFCDGPDLRLHAEPGGGAASGQTTGAAIADLAAAWGVAGPQTEPAAPRALLDDVLRLPDLAIRAWTIEAGGHPGGAGEPAACAALDALRVGLGDGLPEGTLVAVERGGLALAVLRAGGQTIGCAADPPAADAMIDRLRHALSGWG